MKLRFIHLPDDTYSIRYTNDKLGLGMFDYFKPCYAFIPSNSHKYTNEELQLIVEKLQKLNKKHTS